jgi:ATP-dependent DNA helicase RecG
MLDFVQRHTGVETLLPGTARRIEAHDYPPVAVREAVVNAFAHRDYHYDASRIYCHVFADRLEIENPGGLPSGLSPEEFGRRSVRRNTTIADLLYRAGYIENIGSGIERMNASLKENNNPPLEFSSSNFFVLRLRPRLKVARPERLSERQAQLYRMLTERQHASKREAAAWLSVSEDTALRDLMVLVSQGLATKEGTGRATMYRLK